MFTRVILAVALVAMCYSLPVLQTNVVEQVEREESADPLETYVFFYEQELVI